MDMSGSSGSNGMDMGGGGGGNANTMTMDPMFQNNRWSGINIVFPTWVLNSTGAYAGTWFAVFFIAISYEALGKLERGVCGYFNMRNCALHARQTPVTEMATVATAPATVLSYIDGAGIAPTQPEPAATMTPLPVSSSSWSAIPVLPFTRFQQGCRSVVHALRCFVSFFLMVVFMILDTGLCISILSGYACGFFLCAPNTPDTRNPAAAWSPQTVTLLSTKSSKQATSADADLGSAALVQLVPLVFGFLARVFGLLFFIILMIWCAEAEGGFGFAEASVFGLHALFMGLFVIVCLQESLLCFSVLPLLRLCCVAPSSVAVRALHITCHVLSLIFIVLGLVAIVYYKSLSPQPVAYPFFTMYSPHSWAAVALLCMWGIQAIGGSLFGKCCRLSLNARLMLRKLHSFNGKFIYGLALATAALGFQDMQGSDLAGAGYAPDSNLAQYAAAACILLILSGFATFATFL